METCGRTKFWVSVEAQRVNSSQKLKGAQLRGQSREFAFEKAAFNAVRHPEQSFTVIIGICLWQSRRLVVQKNHKIVNQPRFRNSDRIPRTWWTIHVVYTSPWDWPLTRISFLRFSLLSFFVRACLGRVAFFFLVFFFCICCTHTFYVDSPFPYPTFLFWRGSHVTDAFMHQHGP